MLYFAQEQGPFERGEAGQAEHAVVDFGFQGRHVHGGGGLLQLHDLLHQFLERRLLRRDSIGLADYFFNAL